MRASAPGKLVISGAYAVLRGAPAIVTAVNRRVYADSNREAGYKADEVTEGMKLLAKLGPLGPRPWYDATELRSEEDKIGLGSSAAICSASLALLRAQQLEGEQSQLGDKVFLDGLFPICRQAHLLAQGGGSGIDVAAAVYGGTLWARRAKEQSQAPLVGPLSLPAELHFEVWASAEAASTSKLVRKVFAAELSDASAFQKLLEAQTRASEDCLNAAQSGSASDFVAALCSQHDALFKLGTLSSAPIVLPSIHRLHEELESGSCLLPSGAGGGDISLFVGHSSSSDHFRTQAKAAGLRHVPLSLSAPGLTLEATA